MKNTFLIEQDYIFLVYRLSKIQIIVIFFHYTKTTSCLGDEAAIPSGGVKPTFTERPVIRQSDEGNKIIFQCRLAGIF
jgi:hypothetical protein